MAIWPPTLPAPQKNIGISPGDTRKDRRLQSGRSEFRRFGDGKPDEIKALFRLTWAEWDIFKDFHAHDLNLGINWFSADWLNGLGYDAHKARVLGYPREIALQNHYIDVLCDLIVQATADIVIEDTEWPCEPTGAEPEPPPPVGLGYVYGGYGAYVTRRDCDQYDPDVNSWAAKTDIPIAGRRRLAASTTNDLGYIYGGYHSTSSIDCDEYTPGTNSWASKTDMLTPGRYGMAASTIGISGYTYGGAGALNRCDEFTPSTNSWATKTNMLLSLHDLAASTIGSAGYIYGGTYANTTNCDKYDPIANSWTSKTDMPLPARFYLAASTIGISGYTYGGSDGTYLLNDCDQYTASVDTWASKTNTLRLMREMAASTIGSAGYVYGGLELPLAVNAKCEQYIPDTWTVKADMLTQKTQMAASTI